MSETQKKALLVATLQSHIGQFHKPLMKLLKENGWEIHVAARNNLAEKDGLELEYPDVVFDVPFSRSPLSRNNIAAYKQLRAILAANRYDVVHCNTPVGGALARVAANKYRKTGTKVLYTAHGFHFYRGASLFSWLIFYPVEKFLSRFTDKLITINQEDYELARARFHCPVYRLHGVGANSDRYRPVDADEQNALKAELGLAGNVLLIVGELRPNKNQKTAIAMMKEVLKKHPDTWLLIAGNGPDRDALEAQAQAEGVGDRVRFLGYTTHLDQYVRACDVEIACSYREGMPLNVIEALLCGKPVVASRNRGHCELIHDGVNGYLVDPDNTDAYTQRICGVQERAKDYSEEAIRSAEPYKDVNVMKELANIYPAEEQGR